MREYEFRAKAVEPMADGNQWINDGFGVHNVELADGGVECVLYTPYGAYQVDPSTVGQRIGVSDWFDGDLIEITYDTSFIDKEKSVHCIKYRAEEDYPAYDLEPWIDCGMNALSWLMSNSDPSVLSYKVIGNIHDNPELLNAE